jgi:hypothetical protein
MTHQTHTFPSPENPYLQQRRRPELVVGKEVPYNGVGIDLTRKPVEEVVGRDEVARRLKVKADVVAHIQSGHDFYAILQGEKKDATPVTALLDEAGRVKQLADGQAFEAGHGSFSVTLDEELKRAFVVPADSRKSVRVIGYVFDSGAFESPLVR